jgi:hypothetical protein
MPAPAPAWMKPRPRPRTAEPASGREQVGTARQVAKRRLRRGRRPEERPHWRPPALDRLRRKRLLAHPAMADPVVRPCHVIRDPGEPATTSVFKQRSRGLGMRWTTAAGLPSPERPTTHPYPSCRVEPATRHGSPFQDGKGVRGMDSAEGRVESRPPWVQWSEAEREHVQTRRPIRVGPPRRRDRRFHTLFAAAEPANERHFPYLAHIARTFTLVCLPVRSHTVPKSCRMMCDRLTRPNWVCDT